MRPLSGGELSRETWGWFVELKVDDIVIIVTGISPSVSIKKKKKIPRQFLTVRLTLFRVYGRVLFFFSRDDRYGELNVAST